MSAPRLTVPWATAMGVPPAVMGVPLMAVIWGVGPSKLSAVRRRCCP
ncbi:MAG: hypothetical protein MZV63_14915 [Marinilabiliales bacterium]|nr:hypothetical protein [Marinilabiliales bacterium]